MATTTVKKIKLPKPGRRMTFEETKASILKKYSGALAKLAK